MVARNIDSRVKSLGIFLDLSKAFDTVSVPKLFYRLELLGVRGNTLEIFKDYLYKRTQLSKIGEHISEKVLTTYAVPQGSILGPTLFQIYRMNIPKYKIIAYTDDTAIIVCGPSWDSVNCYAEATIRRLMKWFQNCKKTKNKLRL